MTTGVVLSGTMSEGEDPSGVDATARRLVDLLSCEVPGLTDGELAEALVAIDSLGARIAARRSALVDRWDSSMIWAGDGARSAGAWLTARCEVSRGQASWDVHQARALRAMPIVSVAFAEGRLGAAKVRTMVKAREKVEEAFATHEAWLVDQAEGLTVEHAGYLLRRWRFTALAKAGQGEAADMEARVGLHLSQTFDGEWALDGTCDPESGAILKRAIDDEVDALFRRGEASVNDGLTPAKRRMAALIELVRRGARAAANDGAAHGDDTGKPQPPDEAQDAPRDPNASSRETDVESGRDAMCGPPHLAEPSAISSLSGAGRPTVILHIDARTAGREPIYNGHDLEFRANDCDGTGPVTALTLDRMLCDADVVPVIVDGTGEVLDVGRSRRYPTPAMRRALSVRDGGCMFPGCGLDLSRCDAHHVIPWEWDGPTDLANLVMLCRHHHHCVHEGGFILTRGLDRLVRVWRPDGTALPLGRHGAQLADDEPRPAPHPQTTGEPPDVTRQRNALRRPPPPPPEPTRFLEPVEHHRRRYLTDARNVDRQPPELVPLTWATLDIQRGTVQFPDRSASSSRSG